MVGGPVAIDVKVMTPPLFKHSTKQIWDFLPHRSYTYLSIYLLSNYLCNAKEKSKAEFLF